MRYDRNSLVEIYENKILAEDLNADIPRVHMKKLSSILDAMDSLVASGVPVSDDDVQELIKKATIIKDNHDNGVAEVSDDRLQPMKGEDPNASNYMKKEAPYENIRPGVVARRKAKEAARPRNIGLPPISSDADIAEDSETFVDYSRGSENVVEHDADEILKMYAAGEITDSQAADMIRELVRLTDQTGSYTSK